MFLQGMGNPPGEAGGKDRISGQAPATIMISNNDQWF